MPPSIGNTIIGGNMCNPQDAYWVDNNGHPEVHVLWPGVAELSVDFVDARDNILGSGVSGQINDGAAGIVLNASDVPARDVAAAEFAISGDATGMCVLDKL